MPKLKKPVPSKTTLMPPTVAPAPIQAKAKQSLSVPQRIARAANLEGMWTKDVVKFDDLRKKYFIPSTFTAEDVSDAHTIQRVAVARTIATYTAKKPKAERNDDAAVAAEEE